MTTLLQIIKGGMDRFEQEGMDQEARLLRVRHQYKSKGELNNV